jgi:hypothetical protein
MWKMLNAFSCGALVVASKFSKWVNVNVTKGMLSDYADPEH